MSCAHVEEERRGVLRVEEEGRGVLCAHVERKERS